MTNAKQCFCNVFVSPLPDIALALESSRGCFTVRRTCCSVEPQISLGLRVSVLASGTYLRRPAKTTAAPYVDETYAAFSSKRCTLATRAELEQRRNQNQKKEQGCARTKLSPGQRFRWTGLSYLEFVDTALGLLLAVTAGTITVLSRRTSRAVCSGILTSLPFRATT
jgi:hypothetical protein